MLSSPKILSGLFDLSVVMISDAISYMMRLLGRPFMPLVLSLVPGDMIRGQQPSLAAADQR